MGTSSYCHTSLRKLENWGHLPQEESDEHLHSIRTVGSIRSAAYAEHPCLMTTLGRRIRYCCYCYCCCCCCCCCCCRCLSLTLYCNPYGAFLRNAKRQANFCQSWTPAALPKTHLSTGLLANANLATYTESARTP